MLSQIDINFCQKFIFEHLRFRKNDVRNLKSMDEQTPGFGVGGKELNQLEDNSDACRQFVGWPRRLRKRRDTNT